MAAKLPAVEGDANYLDPSNSTVRRDETNSGTEVVANDNPRKRTYRFEDIDTTDTWDAVGLPSETVAMAHFVVDGGVVAAHVTWSSISTGTQFLFTIAVGNAPGYLVIELDAV